MPIIRLSTYRAPRWQIGGDLQTIFPALFRKVPEITSETETLELADGDFLELNWSVSGNDRLAIICHGLEGSARATYVQGMARVLKRRGWDVLAWSMRGCGTEDNRLASFYHSGKTDDLEAVMACAIARNPDWQLDLVGFSLGGNLVLKWLGEASGGLRKHLGSAVVFSVPCDLADSVGEIQRRRNRIYMRRFLKSLRGKIIRKSLVYPEGILIEGLEKVCNFTAFDSRYTGPLHGFRDADDYWQQNSSKQFLRTIRTRTLMVSAANDPMLGARCYPWKEAINHKYLHLEVPAEGGHVGFGNADGQGEYWSETRAAEFLAEASVLCT